MVSTLNTLATTPAPTPAPAPKPTNEQVNDLVADPSGFVGRVAQDAVTKAVQEAVNPILQRTLGVASQQLLNQHATDIDSRFGAGTWNEVFKPQIETDLERIRAANPAAAADPAVMDAIVGRLYGPNFDKLSDRQVAHQQGLAKQEEAGLQKIISKLPPAPGVPRLRQAGATDELDPETIAFLKRVDASVGETTDLKHFAKLHATGTEGPSGHRTDVVDYLRAIGADPATIKAYGG